MTCISSHNRVEARLFLSIKTANQNKLFSPFLSQVYLQHLSQLQLSPPPSALLTSPWSHTWSCSPLPSCQLTLPLPPNSSSSSPPSVLSKPGLTGPGAPPAGAMPGWESLSGEWSLGVPHRWQGVSMWQRVYWTPLFPPAGCCFMTVRVKLSESWLPTIMGQEFKGWVPGCWCLSALWEAQ